MKIWWPIHTVALYDNRLEINHKWLIPLHNFHHSLPSSYSRLKFYDYVGQIKLSQTLESRTPPFIFNVKQVKECKDAQPGTTESRHMPACMHAHTILLAFMHITINNLYLQPYHQMVS